MKRKLPYVAIVGYPNCGKTVLLSVLCKDYSPVNGATTAFSENYKEILKGELPPATNSLEKAPELIWTEFKPDKPETIIKTRDFSGEVWSGFIAENCFGVQKYKHGENEIADFLLGADAIGICVDLVALYDKNDNNQLYIIHAINNFVRSKRKGTTSMALIFTKYDEVYPLVEKAGGLESLLRKKFNAELCDKFRGLHFPVSAIQLKYSHQNKRMVVDKQFKPYGMDELKEWIEYRVQRAKQRQTIVGWIKSVLLKAPNENRKKDYK